MRGGDPGARSLPVPCVCARVAYRAARRTSPCIQCEGNSSWRGAAVDRARELSFPLLSFPRGAGGPRGGGTMRPQCPGSAARGRSDEWVTARLAMGLAGCSHARRAAGRAAHGQRSCPDGEGSVPRRSASAACSRFGWVSDLWMRGHTAPIRHRGRRRCPLDMAKGRGERRHDVVMRDDPAQWGRVGVGWRRRRCQWAWRDQSGN